MTLQSMIVFLVVAGCFGYTVWTLLPQAARRALANGLLRLPLPPPLLSIVEKTASATAGCCCSGCDSALPKAGQSGPGAKAISPVAQVLVFHPRKRP